MKLRGKHFDKTESRTDSNGYKSMSTSIWQRISKGSDFKLGKGDCVPTAASNQVTKLERQADTERNGGHQENTILITSLPRMLKY